MSENFTVIAPVKLLAGVTEEQLLAGSEKFQTEFVDKQGGVLRRELVRKAPGSYLDIVLFESQAAMASVLEAEKTSTVCHEFFALCDMSDAENMTFDSGISLKVYE